MKGTEVPNPRRSSACDCTCVLTRSITVLWLSHTCHAHSVLFLPVQSLLTSFRRSLKSLCNLSLAFLADFWFYCCHAFHSFLSQITLCFSFGSKDMITAFTDMSSVLQVQLYTAGIPLLEAYLQSYCQWPIIELAKNISPSLAQPDYSRSYVSLKWKQNGRYPRGPDSYACVFSAE